MKKIILILGISILAFNAFSQGTISGSRTNWSEIRTTINENFDILYQAKWDSIENGISYDNNVEINDTLILNGNIKHTISRDLTDGSELIGIYSLDTMKLGENITSTTYAENTYKLNYLEGNTYTGGYDYLRNSPYYIKNYVNNQDLRSFAGYTFSNEIVNSNIKDSQRAAYFSSINKADGDSIYQVYLRATDHLNIINTSNSGILNIPEITMGNYQLTELGTGGKLYSNDVNGINIVLNQNSGGKVENHIINAIGLKISGTLNDGVENKYGIYENFGDNYFANDIQTDGKIIQAQITAAVTDNTPTDAEIDAATGLTPATAGAGWQCTIKDSNGTGLLYRIESDGTDWFYTVMTKAL